MTTSAPVDLKQLAAEREARTKRADLPSSSAEGSASGPTRPHPAPPRPSAPRSGPGAGVGALPKVHRSIRMAHSVALATVVSCLVLTAVFGYSSALAVLSVLAVGLARSGGRWLHVSVLPAVVQEGRPPTEEELAAAPKGLFGVQAASDFQALLAEEYAVLVENLAFACTYGKRNCLTGEMYRGDLTMGKVARLVWGKLSEGTVRCA